MVKKLNVARSGYYSWLQRQSNPGKRAQQDEEIAADIELVFKTHRRGYGSPRIHQELRENGRHISRKRVERLMKRQGAEHLDLLACQLRSTAKLWPAGIRESRRMASSSCCR